MWIEFRKDGVNNIMGIGRFYLVENQSKLVNTTFIKKPTPFKVTYTDWISPYILRANEKKGTNSIPTFTGGWHGYNGDGTGSPTARTKSYAVFVDGRKVYDKGVIVGKEVVIEVINYIQAYNTKNIDGTGREVMKETIQYILTEGNVEVLCEIEALEEIVIERYYGIQSDNIGWDGTLIYGEELVVYKGKEDSKYFSKEFQQLIDSYKLVSKDGKHKLIAWMDRTIGLGGYKNLSEGKPTIFTLDYGKTYFNLINGVPKKVKQREILNWRGGYKFSYQETVIVK